MQSDCSGQDVSVTCLGMTAAGNFYPCPCTQGGTGLRSKWGSIAGDKQKEKTWKQVLLPPEPCGLGTSNLISLFEREHIIYSDG